MYLSDNWEIFRAFTDSYIIVQKNRLASENRLRAISQNADEQEKKREKILQFMQSLKREEKGYISIAKEFLREEIVYEEFLKHVKGIGETLSMKLLSFPLELNKNVTSWWAYAGVTPHCWKAKCEKGHKLLVPKDPSLSKITCHVFAENNGKPISCGAMVLPDAEIVPTRSHAGYVSFWNTKFKSFGYILCDCFVKTGAYYRKVYEKFRERANKKAKSARHARLTAFRLTYKLFLSHVHEAGCELKGVPYRKPYQFEFLNHKWFVSWRDVVDIEKRIKK